MCILSDHNVTELKINSQNNPSKCTQHTLGYIENITTKEMYSSKGPTLKKLNDK